MSKQQLKVQELAHEDRWKDMARVPHRFRIDVNGNHIRRGTICKVGIGDKETLLAVRGSPRRGIPEILLDSPTRRELGVKRGLTYAVELRPVGWIGYCRWAWQADDPAYRLPAQISLISRFWA